VTYRAIGAVHHVDDAGVAEGTGIVRLPAGRWIEGRPVEHDSRPAVEIFDAENLRVELRRVGIGVIETVGHGSSERGKGKG
jgi:hypothetical protein